MVRVEVDTIRGVLSELGFKGKMLRDLRDIIVDEETLYTFYNFIIKNEEEEGIITSLLLVYKFKKYMQARQSFADYHEFVKTYNSAHTSFEKKEVIERLFCSKSSYLTKIMLWLNTDVISHRKLYKLAVEYRSQYSVRESIFLIEALHL
ncbi:hypothetical protein J25TS5_20160 [Paenibacillus faecis]|uniref:hypothetical protein n=1 Tax=Paenibacillus faecis TaxID=862114 RepID=UPI001B1DDB26|nr:hypothetical protein [Paenibacillus faecis]GIO85084.1 hypothetical protein J25TS5_20160 [Paenibacillus faecis]